jgi:protease secretion system outer membrane protein
MFFDSSRATTPTASRMHLACAGVISFFAFGLAPAWSMDLLQAYTAAQQQDASILASRAVAEAGREKLPQALSQLLPVVSLSLNRNKNQLSSTTPNYLGVEQTADTNYASSNQTLSLRQPLFRSFGFSQYRQAALQVKEVEAVLREDEQSLAARVAAVYFDAVLAQEQLAIVITQKNANTTYLDAARKRMSAGQGTRTDADEAQARLHMIKAQEIEARQNVIFTLRQLKALVAQSVDKLATLRVAKLKLQAPQPDNLENWIEKAELNNPQFQSLKAKVEVARFEVDRARSGHHPTVDAVAQWSRSESENVTNTSSRYTNAAVGLYLNMPLFAGGAVNSAVRQALASLQFAEQSLELGRRDLGARVHKEFRGVTESMAKIQALEDAVLSADQVVLSNQKSLQAGIRTLIDVLNAEQQRIVTLRELSQARYTYLASQVRLLALVGEADGTFMAKINQVLE